MTRDEATKAVELAGFDLGASNFVDALAALGLLKLDEPKHMGSDERLSGQVESILSEPTVNASQVGTLLGLSRNTVYAAIKRGDIPSIKIGSKSVIPSASIRRMLLGQ